MIADPRTDDHDPEEDVGNEPGNGRSATAPAEGPAEPGTRRDPAVPDD